MEIRIWSLSTNMEMEMEIRNEIDGNGNWKAMEIEMGSNET